MQWMFIDILIPEIAAKMKEEQGFQISDKAVRSILESLSLFFMVCFANGFIIHLLLSILYRFNCKVEFYLLLIHSVLLCKLRSARVRTKS